MYIKVTNGVVEKYPYSIGELRKDNPNTSFPKNPSNTTLESWNVFPVKSTEQPSVDHTKNVKEGAPINESGEWIQTWVVEDASAAEIAERTEQAKSVVREERDQKLTETDWVVIKNLELNQNVPGKWEVYRQDLRDIPAQEGFPFNVTWPVKPE